MGCVTAVAIVPFRVDHAEAYYQLNRLWLDEHALYESADEPYLVDPLGTIVNPGGAVFVAEHQGSVVGTAAVAPYGTDTMELLKLTVEPGMRGSGLGRRLVEACMAHARSDGARRLVLVSNSKLQAALRLYERMGFVHAPLPPDVPYATADVFMTLDL